MRGIIISESKEVERLLNCESSSDWGIGMGKVVMLIGKYYHSLGLNRQEVYKSINSYLKERMDKYTPKKWSEMINNILDTIEKNGWYNLIDVDSISITETEWNTIVGIGNVKLEKIAFVLLCYIKVYRARGSSNDKMNEIANLLLECGITPNRENKILLADLKDLGLIEIGTLRYMFVKPLYINEESEEYIKIDDFDKITHYYEEKKFGWKFIKCCNIKEDGKECGKWERVTKKGRTPKYCKHCSYEIKKKSIALSNKKRRDNNDNI